MPDQITTVGARFRLLGQKEFIAKMDEAQKSQTKMGTVTKAAAEKMAAAAKESAKLEEANKRLAKATTVAADAQKKLDDAMAASLEASAAATGADEAQIVAVNELAASNVRAATAARDAAISEQASAEKAATAQQAAADKSAAASDKASTASAKGASMSKAAMLGIAGATIFMGYEAVKGAVNFQTQMTRLTTAAGMPKATIDASSGAILKLAQTAGFSGTKIAEALYHPISAGLDMATSLKVVSASAKEAQISGASLDDTTYSLSSVMKAFNKPAADATSTMAQLNAIVGDGDMRFQDFNTSVKSWTPVAATFGVDIQSAGAAMAYMTDRGAPAAVAGTQLGMAMTLLGAPSKQAAKMLTAVGLSSTDALSRSGAMNDMLKKSGLTTLKLADDMRGPDGIHTALVDLKTHMEKAGMTADAQSALIARAFGGGKSGKAIMSLMTNLDGLQQKYNQIGQDSSLKHFQEAWTQTENTTRFKLEKIKSAIENFGIKMGTLLLPYVNKVVDAFQKMFDYITSHESVMKTLAYILGGVFVVALIATVGWLGEMAIAMVAATWEFVLIILAVAGLVIGFKYLYDHFKGFHDFVNVAVKDIKNWIEVAWKWIEKESIALWPTIKRYAVEAFAAIVKAAVAVYHWIKDHWSQIKTVAKDIWNFVSTVVVTSVKSIILVIKTVVNWIKDHWSQIKTVAKDIWTVVSTIVKVAVGIIVGIIMLIVTIAKWVWKEIIKPVAGAVAAIIGGFAPIVTFFRKHWGEIKQVAVFVWQILIAYLDIGWGVIKGIFQVGLQVVLAIFRTGFEVLRMIFSIAWDIIVGIIKVVWDVIVTIFKLVRDVILGILSTFLDLVTGHWSAAWKDVKDTFNSIWHNLEDDAKSIMGDLWHMLVSVWDDIGGGIKDIASSLWKDITGIFLAGVNGIIGLVNGFLNAINTIAGAVGITLKLHVPTISASDLAHYAPAPASSDGGATASGISKLARGGQIGGGFVTNGPEVLVGEGNAAYPEYVIPTDPSYRARALSLFNGLQGDLGAMPKLAGGSVLGSIGSGISSIGSGIASAAGSAWNGAKDVASAATSIAKMGLGAAMDAAWPKLNVANGLLGLPDAGINFIRDKILAFVKGKNDAKNAASASGANVGGGTGALPTGEHLALIDAALQADGIPKSGWGAWEAGMSTLIGRESGWNAGIVNNWDSNAAKGTPSGGLTQTILPTFNAFRNPALSANMFDPTANIAASINYILSRYGGIGAVQQANPNMPPKGYAMGGKLEHLEARAFGGGVNAGQPYRVGELGSEVFVPDTTGTMIPNSRPGSPSGGSNGGFGNTYVTVAEGAITVVESRDPRKTYELVKQGIADAVARQ